MKPIWVEVPVVSQNEDKALILLGPGGFTLVVPGKDEHSCFVEESAQELKVLLPYATMRELVRKTMGIYTIPPAKEAPPA